MSCILNKMNKEHIKTVKTFDLSKVEFFDKLGEGNIIS